jgi:hypothetical protein
MTDIMVDYTEKEKAKLRAAGRLAYRSLEEWREANKAKVRAIARENGKKSEGRPVLYAPCLKAKREVVRHRFVGGTCTVCGRTKQQLKAKAKE